MEALRTRQDRVRFIQVRHEEAAAFMACAFAKYTGKLDCCLATSSPGGIHLLVRAAAQDTLIITDGFSCREQIRQTTNREALHLAQVIQIALRESN